jgi:Tfp pilus assembly protein PilO
VKLRLSDKLRPWHVDLAGGCAAALLAAVAYFGVIGPTLDQRVRRAAQADELREETEKGRELQRALRASEARLAAVERATASPKFRLEPASRVNERLSRLTELATAAGVQVDTIEPAKEQAATMYTRVPIRLSGRGKYGDVVRFLVALRRQVPDNAVDEMTLVAQPSPSSPVATFTLGLAWHAAPPAAGPVARK